jgi:hypothetical protein
VDGVPKVREKSALNQVLAFGRSSFTYRCQA